jgi:hypothetical protein
MATRFARRIVIGLAVITAVAGAVALTGGFRRALTDREATSIAVIGGAHIEHLLGPRQFATLGSPIAPDFGVTSSGAIVFQTGGALRVIDTTRAPSSGTRDILLVGAVPDSFSLDPRGTMLTIADGYFGMLNEHGDIVPSIPLPYRNARLAPSVHDGATYLFGGGPKTYRLYRLIDDGTLQILLQSADPIVAAADTRTAMFAATASDILRLKAGTPTVLFKTPPDGFKGPIRSMAVTADGIVMFATDTKVYALLGPNALSIVNNAGGYLRLRDDVLYVLDPTRRMLFSLRPASARLFIGGDSR